MDDGKRGPRRSQARSRRKVVFLVLDHYYPELHAGVVEAAKALDWDLEDERCRGHHGQPFPSDWTPDGVICTTETDLVAGWARDFKGPLVRLLADAAPSTQDLPPDNLPTVELGFNRAGEMAARHLLSLGMPHLAYYRFCHSRTDQDLFRSFMDTCAAAGVRPLVLDYTAAHADHLPLERMTRVHRRDWLEKQLAALPLPCGLMTDDDRFALDAVTVALELGLDVPHDLAVLGCENRALIHGRSPVPVSSIDMNLAVAGQTAALMLQRLMDGKPLRARRAVVPPVRVEERRSTATFVCPDPAISKVVMRIRRDFAQPLSVSLLAREAGVSTRTLQRLYPAMVGTTISEDLMRRRLDAAGRLLRETGLKLETIAMECGLTNAKNLCRLFKDHHGMTPGQWRDGAGDSAAGWQAAEWLQRRT